MIRRVEGNAGQPSRSGPVDKATATSITKAALPFISAATRSFQDSARKLGSLKGRVAVAKGDSNLIRAAQRNLNI